MLKRIYLYGERPSYRKYILLQLNNDISKKLSDGYAIFVHAKLKGSESVINIDSTLKSVKIGDSWYTYADASDTGIKLSDIESISIGLRQLEPEKIISQYDVKL